MAAYGTSKGEVTAVYNNQDDCVAALEALIKTFDSTSQKVVGCGVINVGSGYMGWILGGA
jgi:hypothetical protein